MSAFDYLESRDDADELIEEFGAVASVRRVVASGSETEPTLTPTDYSTFAARVDFTTKQLRDTTILDTDVRLLVAAGPLSVLGVITLATPDKLVLATGEVFSVIRTVALRPAATVVLFDCQCRA
jgi:hypothetical protein